MFWGGLDSASVISVVLPGVEDGSLGEFALPENRCFTGRDIEKGVPTEQILASLLSVTFRGPHFHACYRGAICRSGLALIGICRGEYDIGLVSELDDMVRDGCFTEVREEPAETCQDVCAVRLTRFG